LLIFTFSLYFPVMKGISVSSTTKKKEHFPIVAIGASAGGIQAFIEVLTYLPPDTGMCFIYIQHLDPDHESRLTDILGRSTKMPVLEAKDKQLVKPDHIYIIPPNRELTLIGGHLKLAVRPAKPKMFLPIN
jgi:two-component system CheB/CheR fusion protein